MPESPDISPLHEGLVTRSTGSWYDVRVGTRTVPCKVRGRFRLEESDETNPVVVGDRVSIRQLPDDSGVIEDVHERETVLVRRAAGRRVGATQVIAANVDRAWVVQSVDFPRFNPGFVDRFLVMAEVHRIRAGIVVNKSDLLDRRTTGPVMDWVDLYRAIGYPVLLASAITGHGIAEFASELSGHVTVVAGPSGVGKSTLLNAVDPSLDLRTGGVSLKHRKGMHTTTHAVLLPVSGGGYVADTPGLREFGLVDLDPPHLSHYFREIEPFVNECRYPGCTHDHEPGCRVAEAVSEGLVSEERYASYLGMLASLHLGDRDVGR